MICIPVTGRDVEKMAQEMAVAAEQADVVELRMDYAPGADLRRLLKDRPRPVIVTYRAKRQGGMFEGPEEDRLRLVQKAVDLGAEYVDIELDAAARIRRNPKTRLIVSHHDFERTPSDLGRLHADIVAAGADIVKIATMATDIRDNLAIFDLLRRSKKETIALCMGEPGTISRIIGKKFGGYLTFASIRAGRESAPGQITARDLRTLYRYEKIGWGTELYGVIANPVAHSMSPAIQNAAFEAVGRNAVYLPFKVDGDPVAFVNAFKAIDIKGYSVTLPHKEALVAAMDEVDDLVKRVGALNTIFNREGRLIGANTDVSAALDALTAALLTEKERRSEEPPLKGRVALLLGAGGAARAVGFGLLARGVRVFIANRTHERAEALAREIGCEAVALSDLASVAADILINTTSVGMHPNVGATPFPAALLRPGMVVFDAVYNPPETRLLREARAADCRTLSGLAWFVNQAAAQFELWTERPAPRNVMEKALRERLGK